MEEALTALLESVAGGRSFWGRAPQRIDASQGAYLVLSRIDGPRNYTLAGPTTYVASRVQIDAYATTYTAAKAAARGVIAALSGHRDDEVLGIFVESERDLSAADAGEANHLFRVSVDVIVHTSEG